MSESHTDRLEAALAGRYRIERKLGEGGMASVYLAEDLKHARKVAVKILRPELAAVIGGERFLAEIRTTANLQHPHILPLFDSGEAESYLYYVMPYVDGETLRERIEREGQLSVEDSVRIARDVADALDYAHRAGVIHRDIKPANILLHDGRPVVADFGIALAVSAAGGGRMTETGLSLGTPHYMSPEQASADRDLSARSDVYSLGCVLYEMLAGQPPHTGPSAQSILVRILTEDPRPLADVRRTAPPHVAAAVMKAIEKLPADRFESARAFVQALDDATFTHASVARTVSAAAGAATSTAGTRPARWRTALPWVVTGLATAVAVWSLRDAPAPAPVTRVMLTAAEGQEFSEAGTNRAQTATTLSPDGSQLVYVGASPAAGVSRLWRRRLDGLDASPIAGTEGATAPRFSKDGRFLAYAWPPEELFVIPAEGGSPLRVAGVPSRFAWGDDGAIYFAQDQGIRRWVPGTATAELVAQVDAVGAVNDVLPGSRAVLVYRADGSFAAIDLSSGESHDLGLGRRPLYLSPGHIAYVRDEDSSILVQPFDARTLSVTGPAVSTGAVVQTQGAGAEYAVAADGTLVYELGGSGAGEQLVWLDRAGQAEPIDWIGLGKVDGIAISPSGNRIAAGWTPVGSMDGSDIWVFDLAGRARLPLTRDGLSNRPRWHPTDGSISFARAGDRLAVMRIAADGSGTAQHVVDFSRGPADAWWTADGRELLLRMPGVSTRSIFRFVLGQDGPPEPWLDRDFNERNPAPSPDGHWLAYTSDQSGRDEVYVQPYPGKGAVVAVSIEGGFNAVWSSDGDELFFVGNDGFLWSARVAHDATRFRVESRERLFETSALLIDPQRPQWDVGPDGRFLASRPTGPDGGGLVLVRNWVAEVTGGR